MGSDRIKKDKTTKSALLAVFVFVFVFVLGTSTLAFGAFSSGNSKVLGVGRIQSVAPEAPTDTQTKFLLDTSAETTTIEAITAPIEREVVAAETAVEPPAGASPSGDQTASGSSGEWSSGKASAYGPTDAGVGGYTADGSVFSDASMGVAVPAEWSYLLGSTVEVSYNGIVVTTTVTDTGGFLRYGRVLDLQPGVWRAFGFSNVMDWGVRTVQWRVVG